MELITINFQILNKCPHLHMTTIRLLTEEMIILTEEDMEDITSINNKILSTKITTSTANNSNMAVVTIKTT